MLTDKRIIHRSGAFEIQAQRHEVLFPQDGSAVALHPVRHHGCESLFHRAFITPAGLRVVLDIRQICPQLDKDLRTTLPRDVPGTVFYTLRQAFKTSAEFYALALARYEAAWLAAQDLELLPEAA
jgi:hypothetical protein